MSASSPLIVVVHGGQADPWSVGALEYLRVLSEYGLLRPFWAVTSPDDGSIDEITAERIEEGTRSDVLLFRSLAEVVDAPTITRVLAVATQGMDPEAVPAFATFVRLLAQRVERLQPATVPLRTAQMVFPELLTRSLAVSALFDPEYHANLVVIPEDRRADTAFATDVRLSETDAFAAHVAVETATHGGLWKSMEEAPIDSSTAGVIDGAEAKVRFARSYACAAIGPALPLWDAVMADDALPLPADVDRSPSPASSIAEAAERVFLDTPAMRYEEPERYTPNRPTWRTWEGWKLYGRTARDYVRSIPTVLRRSLRNDVEGAAGQVLTAALGEYAAGVVVWTEKGTTTVADDPVALAEAISASIERRLEQVEAPPVDQQQWQRLVVNVTAVVDANPSASVVLSAGQRRLAVPIPSRIGPPPGGNAEDTAVAIADEPMTSDDGTLLGRISALGRREEKSAERDLGARLGEAQRLAERIRQGEIRRLSALTWSIGTLSAAVLSLLAVRFELLARLGIDDWSSRTRFYVGGAFSAAALIIAFINLMSVFVPGELDFNDQSVDEDDSAEAVGAEAQIADGGTVPGDEDETPADGELEQEGPVLSPEEQARRAQRRRRRVALVVSSLPVVIGCFAAYRLSQVNFNATIWRDFPPEELVVVGGVILSLVSCLLFTARESSPASNLAARLIGVTLVVYFWVAVVGLVGRRGGWYARSSQDLGAIVLRVIGAMLVVIVVLFGMLVFYRVRERLSIAEARERLRWNLRAAEAAGTEIIRLRASLRQYHGTAAALDRIVWLPFGAPPTTKPNVADFAAIPALKLQIVRFTPSERGRTGALARVRSVIATPGWVHGLYGTASEAFLPELAFILGRDLSEVADQRPERDPTVTDLRSERLIPSEGPRWRFASLLHDGALDEHLLGSGQARVTGIALSRYLEPVSNDGEKSVLDHGLELIRGYAPRLHWDAVNGMGPFRGADERAELETTIWWPAPLDPPVVKSGSTTILRATVDDTDPAQLIIGFVRSDWSQEFPLGRLSIAGRASVQLEGVEGTGGPGPSM